MTRRHAVTLLLGSLRANDLRLCGPATGEKPADAIARQPKPYLAFDLRSFAGVRVIGPTGDHLVIPVKAIWRALLEAP